jgi:hypothetical protein
VLVAIGYIPGEVGAKAPEGQSKTISPQAGGDTAAGAELLSRIKIGDTASFLLMLGT